MALSDYFSGVPIRSSDKEAEDFLRAAKQYAGNRQVLQALGEEDTARAAKPGLLSQTLNVLGAPGRLIRGGLFELAGTPTPELAATSGIDQFRKLLSGDIRAGFGELPALRTRPNDDFITKVAKLGTAFIGDVATDPISYISAPGALSRKAAASVLLREGSKLVPDIASANKGFGKAKLDTLFENSPISQAAKVQAQKNVPAEAGSPLDLLSNPENVARFQGEELGNYLAEGLIKGGRKEVIRRLEDLTGSKDAALALFKKLPEEVRGGIVVSGLLGKPLRRADGSYIRLTEGTGESLGKLGDVLNTARLGASVIANPITSRLGKAGQALAGTRTALLKGAEEQLGRDRFIDYIKIKDSIGNKESTFARLNGAALAEANRAAALREKYKQDELALKEFDTLFEEAFFRPNSLKSVTGTTQADAIAAATRLRDKITEMHKVAKEEGIDIGEVGDYETWTPLVMTEESVKRRRQTDRSQIATGEYSTVYGRDSYVKALQDPEVRARAGFEDPKSPGVVYFDAKEVNRINEERGFFERFETDPLKIFGKYASDLSSRIANKRFLTTLEQSGVLIKDVPAMRRLLAEKESADYVAALTNISPDVKAEAIRLRDEAAKKLATVVDYKKIQEVKDTISTMRANIKAQFDSATNDLSTATDEYRKARASVRALEPRVAPISRRINELRRNFVENAQDISERQRAARNIRAELFNAEVDDTLAKNDYRNLLRRLRYRRERVATPEELGLYDELIEDAKLDREAAVAKLDELSGQKDLVEQGLNFARQERANLVRQEAQTQIAATDEYVNALERAFLAEEAMINARAARNNAASAYRNIEADVAFESVNNIDAIVENYAAKSVYARTLQKELRDNLEKLRYNKVPKDQYAAAKKAADAAIKQANSEALAAKDIIKETLGYTSRKFEGVAREYANELLSTVDELTVEQFQALRVLTSERKLQELIQIYERSSRDETVAMQAIGDMVKVYNDIADKISPETIEKLSNLQQNILNTSNVSRLIREEKIGSKLAEELTGKFNYDPVNLSRRTADLYGTAGVTKTLAEMHRIGRNPTDWERVVSDFLDPLLNLWKTAVTVGRGPGYVATNTIGGIYMNYLGNVSMKNTKLAAKALLDINSELKAVQTANPTISFAEALEIAEKNTAKKLGNVKIGDTDLYTVIDEFFKRGAFFDTETEFALRRVAQGGTAAPLETYRRAGAYQREYTEEATSVAEQRYRATIDFLITNRVQRALNNMAQNSELFLRLSAFIDGFEKYKNFDSALSNVHLLHFNYQDLSNAEQWVRRFVPFYTWTRNNVPAQLRALAMQPGKIQRALYANEEFKNTFGAQEDESWMNQVLPEYISVSDGYATSFKFGNNNIGYYLRLPFEDINRLFQVKSGLVLPRARELANLTGPFTLPLEVVSGIDLGTGAPFSERGTAVPSYYNLFRAIPGSGVYTDIEGQTRAAGGFAKSIQELFPVLSTAERAVTGASVIPSALGVNIPEAIISKSQQEKALADLLNITGIAPAVGVSAVTLTPRALSGELRGRIEKQRGVIGRLAATGNYDTDFIREQLRNGRSPEEVAVLLASGMGQIKPETESGLQESTRRRYVEQLRGL